jgi:predicted tellurium resistance membrane protein TerC
MTMESTLLLVQSPAAWLALITLIAMEVVLGIDNLIFISILTNKLPEAMRDKARRLGISLALVMRLLLLATVSFIVKLTTPLFNILDHGISWRDLILIAGGAFLIWKATREIHHNVAADAAEHTGDEKLPAISGFASAIGQIVVLDLVFSIDSIITAVGMTEHLQIMFVAVIVAVMAMMFAARPLANFINDNPSIVMLALAFLIMIGMTLVAEGLGNHVPKGYIYAAMAFSAVVEGLNMFARRRRERRAGESQ